MFKLCPFFPLPIRALSAHSAAEFNILPGRWQLHKLSLFSREDADAPPCRMVRWRCSRHIDSTVAVYRASMKTRTPILIQVMRDRCVMHFSACLIIPIPHFPQFTLPPWPKNKNRKSLAFDTHIKNSLPHLIPPFP
jgi:hypothetical protein